ncbi:uncharacterized protein LOC18020379 [Eutrema salsugineum]|uniref:uncharacterized protein LOC18020379 n=1 Tax=Eutrema salsugineum TaxID=72664 RepID=UPI000CED5614|nr:uncharacterized protein LOC18020379 [Eutrema salsugineum]
MHTSSTAIPDSEQSRARSHMEIEDLVDQPNRRHCIRLDPMYEDGTWFKLSHAITKAILRMLHNLLDKPYERYSYMPRHEKDLWHRTFAQEFTWDRHHTTNVLNTFDKYAATQYSQHMYEWKQKWLQKKHKPKDLEDDVWKGFCEYWDKPATKKLSTTNSKNRRSERNGKGMYIHNGGAKTIEREAMEMAKKAGGIPPDFLELLEIRHTNKKTGVIQDPEIREKIEICKKRKEDKIVELSQFNPDGSIFSNEIPREEINDVVLSEIQKVKGRFVGLGGLPSQESSSSSYYAPSANYKADIDKLSLTIRERDEEVAELKAANQSTQQELSDLKAVLKTALPNFFK